MPYTQEDLDGLCLQALETFGEEPQIFMAMEECGELISAIGKWVRGRPTDIIGEVADVTIMMRQLAHLFGENAVEHQIRVKLERLALRIGRHKK